MNELIPVNYDGDAPTVSGRELHKACEVETAKVTGKGQLYFINKLKEPITV